MQDNDYVRQDKLPEIHDPIRDDYNKKIRELEKRIDDLESKMSKMVTKQELKDLETRLAAS